MDNDRFAVKFFAAEIWPDECEEETHEENDDGLGGIGSGRSDGDGWCGDEGGTIGELLDGGNGATHSKWNEEAMMAFSVDDEEAFAKFGH